MRCATSSSCANRTHNWFFDVDLARSHSEDNPVYYIQMAHARVCGIFRVGEIAADSVTGVDVDYTALAHDDERELVKALLGFPAALTAATRARAPHILAGYLLETARCLHTWYHKHHVLGEAEPVRSARLALARAAQVVLRNGLRILGINAPERM